MNIMILAWDYDLSRHTVCVNCNNSGRAMKGHFRKTVMANSTTVTTKTLLTSCECACVRARASARVRVRVRVRSDR